MLALRKPIKAGDGDSRHGTLGGYINHNCRCAECRVANRDYNARRRKERKQGQKPSAWAVLRGASGEPRMHNRYTYSNWGCRCERCKADNSLMQSQYLAKRNGHGVQEHVCDAPFPVTPGMQWQCPVCRYVYMGGEVNHPKLGKVLGWSSV